MNCARPTRTGTSDATTNGGGVDRLLVDRLTAAKMLGISGTTLDLLRIAGQIPSLKIGTRRLFALADLQTFVATRRGVGQ
jgi:excisionase family DNA binding protein